MIIFSTGKGGKNGREIREMERRRQNCALFVKIHKVNGRATITDKMFEIRQNMRLAASMAKADNWKDAKTTIRRNKNILEGLESLCPEDKIEEFKVDLKSLLKIDEEIENIIEEKESDELNKKFKGMIGGFNKMYVKYL